MSSEQITNDEADHPVPATIAGSEDQMVSRRARVIRFVRQGKTLVVLGVIAPAVLTLAMGSLALLRPAQPTTQVQPAATAAPMSMPTSTPASMPTVTVGARQQTPVTHSSKLHKGPGATPGPH